MTMRNLVSGLCIFGLTFGPLAHAYEGCIVKSSGESYDAYLYRAIEASGILSKLVLEGKSDCNKTFERKIIEAYNSKVGPNKDDLNAHKAACEYIKSCAFVRDVAKVEFNKLPNKTLAEVDPCLNSDEATASPQDRWKNACTKADAEWRARDAAAKAAAAQQRADAQTEGTVNTQCKPGDDCYQNQYRGTNQSGGTLQTRPARGKGENEADNTPQYSRNDVTSPDKFRPAPEIPPPAPAPIRPPAPAPPGPAASEGGGIPGWAWGLGIGLLAGGLAGYFWAKNQYSNNCYGGYCGQQAGWQNLTGPAGQVPYNQYPGYRGYNPYIMGGGGRPPGPYMGGPMMGGAPGLGGFAGGMGGAYNAGWGGAGALGNYNLLGGGGGGGFGGGGLGGIGGFGGGGGAWGGGGVNPRAPVVLPLSN